MRRGTPSLILLCAGVASVFGGVAWDAILHGRGATDEHERLVTLANPSHAVVALGMLLALAGLTLMLDGRLAHRGASAARRSTLVATAALLVVGTAGAVAVSALPEPGRHPETLSTELARPSHGDDHGDASAVPVAATEEQRAAAQRLVNDTSRAVARFSDIAVARDEGYTPITNPTGQLVHYINFGYHRDTALLDPEHPEVLMFVNTKSGPLLVGAMYLMPSPGMPGPQIGGPLTIWHAHHDLCFSVETRVITAHTRADGSCPEGSEYHETPEMLHVWTVPNPGGPFAPEMEPAALTALAQR